MHLLCWNRGVILYFTVHVHTKEFLTIPRTSIFMPKIRALVFVHYQSIQSRQPALLGRFMALKLLRKYFCHFELRCNITGGQSLLHNLFLNKLVTKVNELAQLRALLLLESGTCRWSFREDFAHTGRHHGLILHRSFYAHAEFQRHSE